MSESDFYLGRTLSTPTASGAPLHYSPDDLTTHAIIVGMTGSGKTGLLITLLEEAALLGLPAIVIDPKGDLTNLLLHFPDLLPADFEPWIDPEAARRAGMDLRGLAAATAQRWKEGLAAWDQGPERLAALRDAADYVVYTPGSSAGEPVNLLASFVPPAGLNWDDHREILRERIASTAAALLGLVGIKEIDPLRSREHILLSNIIETAWRKAASLDLTELILQVQKPPFERLGAFPIDNFFPEKERLALALQLNNFLAAPSFQTWIEGDALDPEDLFRTPAGKPRLSIFYLAHLDETERMFFVTLLLASLESWMRAQRGSPGLRALLAFDEITGYLPPIANPPSRTVLLRLLKQARAFGLGLVLASQNPVDLDYKGLSNAGTWFVGRLQTPQDRDRLLDGLQSIEGGMDRGDYADLISALKPRNFLLHNIHASAAKQVFETRWCLNYLAGPLTRAQIGGLKALGSGPDLPPLPPEIANAVPVNTYPRPLPTGGEKTFERILGTSGAQNPQNIESPSSLLGRKGQGDGGSASDTFTHTPPAPPAGVQALFVPPELSVGQALARLGGSLAGPVQPSGLIYRPGLLFQAEARFYNRRYGLDASLRRACLVAGSGFTRVDWPACSREPFDPRRMDAEPLPETRFAGLPPWISAPKTISAVQKDFLDWVYRTSSQRVFANENLKLYSSPEDSHATFRQKCDEVSRQSLRAETERIQASFDAKLSVLARKVDKQEAIVDKYEDQLGRRRMEEVGTNFELFFSIFSRRKRSISSALSKGRMTSQARAELEAADQALDAFQDEYNDLAAQKSAALKDAQDRWARAGGAIVEIPITPLRKDIFLEISGLAWLPVYQLQSAGRLFEAPAY